MKGEEEMSTLVTALGQLFEALLKLLMLLLNFLTGMISLQGFLAIVIAAFIFYAAWRQTKNLLGAVIWLVVTFLTVYILTNFILWPFIFKGSQGSLQSCYANAGGDPNAKALCDTMSGVKSLPVSQSQQQSQQQQPVVVVQPTLTQVPMVRSFQPTALSILIAQWPLRPGDWPSKMAGQLRGPADVPAGVKVVLKCVSCGASKPNEVWEMTLTDTLHQNVLKVTVRVNGYFARESKGGFNANPDGSEMFGTGSWENVCPTCYTDVVVATPTSTLPPEAPTATQPPPASGLVEGTQVQIDQRASCGYTAWIVKDGVWKAVPTTGGQPDYDKLTSEETARKACPSIQSHP